jgi:hypothetical protein
MVNPFRAGVEKVGGREGAMYEGAAVGLEVFKDVLPTLTSVLNPGHDQ